MARPGLILAACWGLGAVGISGVLTPADPVAAEALWAWAQEASSDLTAPEYIDATEAAARLRPWHPGYEQARERIEAVDLSRRRTRRAASGASRGGASGAP